MLVFLSFVGRGAQTSLISMSPKIIYGGFFVQRRIMHLL